MRKRPEQGRLDAPLASAPAIPVPLPVDVPPTPPPAARLASEMTIDEQLTHDKHVEFYAALAAGWVDTRMEFDRTLVALSGAGIGLFATLLTTVGVNTGWEALCYGVGAGGFVGAIIAGLWIFLRNADFFQELVKGGGSKGDPLLKRLDRALVFCFAVGALGAVGAGTLAAVYKHQQTESGVSKEAGKPGSGGPSAGAKPAAGSPATPRAESTSKRLDESVNGLQQMRPDLRNVKTGSVDGVQNLKPTGTTPTGTAPPNVPPPGKKP